MKPVLGYHVIFSAYGFWLPNDPRGSWSKFVGDCELYRAGGRATTTTERRALHRDPHDRAKRLAVKRKLARPAVRFDGLQAWSACQGFGEYARASGLRVWACAIMPDHVHMVTGPFRLSVESVVNQLKGAATRRLIADGRHPFAHLADPGESPPKCWGRGLWSVFLDAPEDIVRCIRYVENNPTKDGKPRQSWSFVTPYEPGE